MNKIYLIKLPVIYLPLVLLIINNNNNKLIINILLIKIIFQKYYF